VRGAFVIVAIFGLAAARGAQEREPYLGAPIRYEDAARNDIVARVLGELQSDGRALPFDEARGWLPALLELLDLPVESQVLVFSKTSLQSDRISPATPRAIYFNDDAALAWIPGSPVMELTTFDPVQGPTFYAIEQRRGAPVFERRDDSCLTCHASPRTQGWPGHLVRSVHPDARGFPILRAGTYRTTDASPLEERWGGWYVTGTSGGQRHMGNATVAEGVEGTESAERLVEGVGVDVVDLAGRFDTARYPSPHSDIVALMVLEHQNEVQNVLARASYEGRRALDYQRVLNEALGEGERHISESTHRRIQRAAEDVVDALLFKDAAPLTGPVRGTSGFTEAFQAHGVRDSEGRSLRDLDLERRLLRIPCSYLIHSPAMRQLPALVDSAVWRDLGAILRKDEGARAMPKLSGEDRANIRAHLRETLDPVPQDL